MVNFIVKNLIAQKLSFEKVQQSKTYSPYIDAVIAKLDNRGYTLNDNGECVVKPE